MTKEEYQKLYSEDDAVGWECINEQLRQVYGEQKERHYPAPLHFIAGGSDPLDGVSIYDNKQQTPHRHLVGFGMSQLYYDVESVGNGFSKWGFEFTFRLVPFAEDNGDPFWAIEVMNNLARYVFNSGNWFEEYHFVPSNGPIRKDTDSDIVGLAFCVDPELGTIETPHGIVTFLQLVGLTSKELERLKANPTIDEVEILLNEMRQTNPLLITDLTRKF